MARDVIYQKNPWGTLGGSELQRSDLWMLDLSQAVKNVSDVLQISLPVIAPYFAQSVSFPELVVKADTFRRNSNPYNMPTFDEPPGPVRVVFLADAPDAESSDIYQVLDAWRAVVRAGRGALGTEQSVLLNDNFRIDFAFNVTVTLLKGGHATSQATLQRDQQLQAAVPGKSSSKFFTVVKNLGNLAQQPRPNSPAERAAQERTAKIESQKARTDLYQTLQGLRDLQANNDLQFSSQYTLENAWLGSFKVNELAYPAGVTTTIEAQFYVENVLDVFNRDRMFFKTAKVLQ